MWTVRAKDREGLEVAVVSCPRLVDVARAIRKHRVQDGRMVVVHRALSDAERRAVDGLVDRLAGFR